MIASQRLASLPDLGLARGADGGERDDVDFRADPLGARDRLGGQRPQDRLEPVVARVVEMVGLGGGEQDSVDARAEDRGEARGPAGAEGAQHVGERVLEVAQRRGTGIQRGQRVDQHDLAVEPGEMIAEERAHHMRLIGLVAALHHRRHGARRDRVAFAERDRRESQRGRALEVARHQEPSGRQGGQRIDVVARPAQIGGEAFGDVARRVLVRLGVSVEAFRARRASPPTAARGPASRWRAASPAPIRRKSCRGAAGRAAIRRDSRRDRPRGSSFARPSRPRSRIRWSGEVAKCAASIAASAGRAR